MPNPEFKFSFDCIYYHAKDMEKAIAFYRDVLGFPLKSRDYVARFDVDGVLFELVPAHEERYHRGTGQCTPQPRSERHCGCHKVSRR